MILGMEIHIRNLYRDLRARMLRLREDLTLVRASRKRVDEALEGGRLLYGITTGFGILADKVIPPEEQRLLQRNLLLSHAVGVGPLLPKELSALMLELKLHALGLGYSGVSEPVVARLLDFVERGLSPAVPEKGSVGASGDLAPLAHLSLPLIGQGAFWDPTGSYTIPARQVLFEHGLEPVELEPKDGLALINGTQFMSAHGAYVLHRACSLVKTADLLASMSLEALRANVEPFDERIHSARPHPGQRSVAANIRRLLAGSSIVAAKRGGGRVQDPYSLRCIPQVHGASRDALAYAERVLEIEINSATDNPLVFENGDILSGGNFHGQPIAIAMDLAAIALAELASISERRVSLLLEGGDGLPLLLMEHTGVNSGFMIPQYTAAALVSENKVLCHPASVDSIPTCLGQEDHVSMGSISAVKLLQVLRNTEEVLAIELFTVAQALDYRKTERPGRGVELAHHYVRSIVPHAEADKNLGTDLSISRQFVETGDLVAAVEEEIGELE